MGYIIEYGQGQDPFCIRFEIPQGETRMKGPREYDDCEVWSKADFKVKRKLWISDDCVSFDYKGQKLEQPKYKYKEELEFQDCKNGKKAICIGFNPALAIRELDATNKRLCEKLRKKGYSKYFLFNLYPEVVAHKENVNVDDEENKNSLNYLRNEIQNIENCDVVLFFGRSTSLNEDQTKFIEELCDGGRKVFLTTFKGEFIHPGAIGSFDLTPFKKEYLINVQSCFIKIKNTLKQSQKKGM